MKSRFCKKEKISKIGFNSVQEKEILENRSLTPVKLCPDLYLEVLNNALLSLGTVIGFIQRQDSLTACRFNMSTIVKFAMIGKEGLFGLFEMFKLTKKLCFGIYVECSVMQTRVMFENKSTKLLAKLIAVAAPNVSMAAFYVAFHDSSTKWQDVFFHALLEKSNQKRLAIENLPKINCVTRRVFQNLAEKGVMLELTYIKQRLLEDLPQQHYENLSTCADAIRNLGSLKFTFRKLEITEAEFLGRCYSASEQQNSCLEVLLNRLPTIPFVEELTLNGEFYFTSSFKSLYTDASRNFPNTKKFVFRILSTASSMYRIKQKLDELKKFMSGITDEINIMFWFVSYFPADVVQHFNGNQIDRRTYEWNSESDEKKVIRLSVRRVQRKEMNFYEDLLYLAYH